MEHSNQDNQERGRKFLIGCFGAVIILAVIIGVVVGIQAALDTDDLSSETKSELYGINVLDNRYYITDVDDGTSGLLKIEVDLTFEPASYEAVRPYADEICYEAYDILASHGKEKDISVWVQRDLEGDRVRILGQTFYSDSTGRFQFRNADQLF